jgi:tetratricopeptide (TPR) repeat protein
VEEDRIWGLALLGFAEFAERCHALLTGGRIKEGVDRLLKEIHTLQKLAELRPRAEPVSGNSQAARLATAALNGLILQSHYSLSRSLVEAGLQEALHLEDRVGEANCLKGLGDLCLRDSDLSGARGFYEEALPLYRAISDRLGEANVRQSLGRAELIAGNAPEAFRRFLELLKIYGEIRERLGQQAALGYLARCARASSVMDQAVMLAEASLAIGREAGDRFGQTITLDLQISTWIDQENYVAAVAGMLIYRDLSLQIHDSGRAERFQPVIDGVLPQLPEEVREILETEPEKIRLVAVAQAQERMEKAGVELFDVPSGGTADE